MKTKIHTYKDLQQEKKRLRGLFDLQKKTIKNEISGIKESLKPINIVTDKIKQFTTREHSAGLINTGVDIGLNFLLKNVILRKASWATRLIATPIIKNIASHLVAKGVKNNQVLHKFLDTTGKRKR